MSEPYFSATVKLNQEVKIDTSKVTIETEGNSGSGQDGTVVVVLPDGEIWFKLYR